MPVADPAARDAIAADADPETAWAALAAELETVWVPEHGRWYWEGRRHLIDQRWTTDEFRRKVEEMSPEEYRNSTFYGRRLDGMVGLLIEKGVIDERALEERTRTILEAGTRDHV